MKVYRECDGIQFGATQTLTVTGHPTVTTIPLTRITQIDISPLCNSIGPHITCATVTAPNQGAIEEHIYVSNPVTLPGVPPASGWIFNWGDCCRNPSTNITNASSKNWRLRAAMFPYTPPGSTVPIQANPCFDNSPVFAERPSTVICTSYPFTYNHNAFDYELDSLAYEWAPPLENLNQPVTTWATGYSYLSPLPSTVHNPNNVPATVNPYTGEISFTSFTQGAFQTVIKVTAYKCGIKVAEIFREMQIVLLACGINNPPVVTAPFQDPISGLYTLYVDTVYAGALVTFPMSGTDFEFLPNNQPQTMTITASGSQFGANYSNTTSGCINPPCAVLNPPPPITGQFGVQTNFSWQTDCSHLASPTGCGTTSNIYNFLIKVQDDFCPAPAINISTITIIVLPPPVLATPDFRCVSVAANGDVTLNWIAPVDSFNSFNSYHIFSSTSPTGPFTLVDTVPILSQTSYTHVGANANTNSVYYYIQTRSGCDGLPQFWSISTDTLQSINLTAVNNGSGNAQLDWNPISNPLLPTSDTWYMIYREYPSGIWQLIDSTQSLQYFEAITLCNANINYRIEIADSSGCISVSNIDGDVFQDLIAPDEPLLDSVSVNITDGTVSIGWTPSISPDADGYVVYQNIGGIWTAIDTVWGGSSASYLHSPSNANSASQSYTIAAFDSCMNISPMVLEHKTIYLTASIDICDAIMTLNWTPYINMSPLLTGYRVWCSENNGPWNLLSTVSAGTTTYTHSGLQASTEYCYYIQAFNDNGISSSSNKVCMLAVSQLQPQFVYLKTATVVNNSYVDVSFLADSAAYIKQFKIQRSLSSTGPFTTIASLPFTSPSLTYSDLTALVNYNSYYYKIVVVDSCDNEISSNLGRTIYLTAEGIGDMTNEIYWNNYELWSGTVQSYNIYRKVDDNFEPLANVPSNVNSYVDNVSNFTSSEGLFTYYVVANEGLGNIYNLSEVSTSNQAIAKQIPKMFVPSAFVPKGYNKVFKPFGIFIDASDYSFLIFSRWGEVIFETTDPNVGWDGTYRGNDAQFGVYTYLIQFRNTDNVLIQKRGTVTLLR
ncbi:MAG: gliding motility-associated C-terminal domain-containing protein [Bacteroidales bacterium]|nr:gliding motility-associated C-terminal domain-containing protein [Bacteroidales bacterium]